MESIPNWNSIETQLKRAIMKYSVRAPVEVRPIQSNLRFFCYITGFRLWRRYRRQYWGYIFFGGVYPSKMGRFAPFLATIQAISKICVFLFNKRIEGCFVSDAPPLVLAPTVFIIALFSWVSVGDWTRLVLKLAKECTRAEIIKASSQLLWRVYRNK
jgi:hypothetical protein